MLVKSWIANYRFWPIPVVLWTLVVGISLEYTLRHGDQAAFDVARQQGRDIFQTMVGMRRWNAETGGVYVRQSNRNPPNPYLDIPDRDPVTTSGIHLTAINPAYMTRLMGEVIARDTGIRIRITSTKPVNPDNAPKDWEAVALGQFASRSAKEYAELVNDAGHPSIRYVAPLYITEPCLACHRKHGYAIGDLRGGISVTIPAAEFFASQADARKDDMQRHAAAWLAGMVLILFALWQGRRRWQELEIFNSTLEDRVNARTHELQQESLRRGVAEAEARKLADRYQSILQASPDGFWLVDRDGVITDVNDAYCRMIGYPRQAVLTKRASDFERDVDRGSLANHLQMIAGEAGSLRFETRQRNAEGGEIDVEMSIASIPAIEAFSCFLRDITERKHVEERLELAATVFTHSREGIMITDTSGTILDVNASFSQITGYARGEVIGRKPSLLSSGKQDQAFYREFWNTLVRKGYWYGEIWNRRKDGSLFVEYLTVSAAHDKMGTTTHYIALCSDITAHKEHERQIEHIRHFDTLTGLPNRTLFGERLRQAISFARRSNKVVAVAYMDLDGFRDLNEKIGREAGDRILVEMARRLRRQFGDGDTVARIGGDEFALVLMEFDSREHAESKLSAMLSSMMEPIQVGDTAVVVSASIGASFFPQPDLVDSEQLFRQADQAMYQAKLAGKNRLHIFDLEHDQQVRGLHASIEEIERGLATDQFVLHFQPKVDLRTGAIVGAEALIRWNHPTRGLLQPGAFLPITEDHPVSIQIGEWVVERALRHVREWQTHGFSIPVSVNISGRHLQTGDFADKLKATLSRHPTVSPTMLEIEILETSALSDVNHVIALMNSCSEAGVSFSLDDFGTGYSSLAYLKRLPITTLKIDQGFIRDMLDDPDDLSILVGIISLARALDHELVAEGVESIEHGLLLLRLGCTRGQGYGIARPMPADELAHWAAEWTAPQAWKQAREFPREHYPVLAAQVEHRAWAKKIEGFLKGDSQVLPPLDILKCPFGKWLSGAGMSQYGPSQQFDRIDQRHRQIHALAAAILENRSTHDAEWISQQLAALRSLSSEMLGELDGLAERQDRIQGAS